MKLFKYFVCSDGLILIFKIYTEHPLETKWIYFITNERFPLNFNVLINFFQRWIQIFFSESVNNYISWNIEARKFLQRYKRGWSIEKHELRHSALLLMLSNINLVRLDCLLRYVPELIDLCHFLGVTLTSPSNDPWSKSFDNLFLSFNSQ